MFSSSDNTSPFPLSTITSFEESNPVADRSLQMKMDHSRESREHKLSRMRQISNTSSLIYEGVSFNKFRPLVERELNPYTLLITIFQIADDFTWRQYLGHLELLIKKFTNFVESSKGKVLD